MAWLRYYLQQVRERAHSELAPREGDARWRTSHKATPGLHRQSGIPDQRFKETACTDEISSRPPAG